MESAGRFSKWLILASSVVAVVVAFENNQPALAQTGGPRRPSISVQAFNACTTTDYTTIVANAINITPAILRKDVVSGQTLQDIITNANIDPQVVLTAYQTARKADIDQAVKEGVITQDEATTMEATPVAPASTPAATAVAGQPGQGGRPATPPFPDIGNLNSLIQQLSGTTVPPNTVGFGGGGIGLGIGANTFNLVKQYAVAAQVLNMKCTDLVKQLITPPGQSLRALSAAQNVDPKVVSDALTKVYTNALAQDVTDGVITQAQSDQVTPLVTTAVTVFVGNPYPMGQQGTPKPQS